MFDIKKAIETAKQAMESTTLMGLVLSPSGGGKSSLAGTFGVPTLYLHTSGEDHGPSAARAFGGDNILPVCFSKDEQGNTISSDKSYANLLFILDNIPDGVGAVVIDGATEVENIIRETDQFKKACLSEKGKHNAFAEPQAVGDMFRPVLEKIRSLRGRNIHTLMTCILEVSSMGDDGEFLESKPKLSTYSVVENIIQGFPHVIVVGRMTKNDKVAYRLQFMTNMHRSTKDGAGIIKKCINYRPRLAGHINIPDTMPANLASLIKYLKGEKSNG